MSPAKTCSEIFTASLHLIEVLAATTTASSARCAGLGPSLSPILRPVWGLDSRVRLSRGPLLRGPRARVRKVVRSSAGQRSGQAPTSAPQDGVSSGAIAGIIPFSGCIISTRSSGDLARELKEDPRAGVGGPTPACKRRADQGGREFSCGLPSRLGGHILVSLRGAPRRQLRRQRGCPR